MFAKKNSTLLKSKSLIKCPVFEIIAVGTMKQKFSGIQESIQEYLKRLQPYAPTLLTEAPEMPLHASMSEAHIMREEALWIERYLRHKQASTLIALSERGHHYSSTAWAEALARWEPRVSPEQSGSERSGGTLPPTVFLIGGSLGLHPELIQQATACVSLSAMTFPHHLARLILVEQLYRGCRILKGHAYHH